jgi:hypothetical protein
MSDRPSSKSRLKTVSSSAAPFLLVLLAGAGAAHATDEDPFADEGHPPAQAAGAAAATPSPQAPASAPAPTASNFAPGPVEQLPSSAYPEPFVRGLYGGSLWGTFHGMQWPYYPRTGIGISGYAWLDNSYERLNVGDPSGTQPQHPREYLQQGRLLLRITPTYSRDNWFVQAQAEMVANKDQSQLQPAPGIAQADDVWVRVGEWQKWDVQIGRFEGFEVYHLGMGLDLNTEERRGAFDRNLSPPDLYGATFLFYRPGSSGNVALHVFPTRSLRLELLAQYGTTSGNEIGGRPAVVYDIGILKLKIAAEYELVKARDTADRTESRLRGVGGTAQVVLDPWVELGANAGYAILDFLDLNGNPDTGRSGNELSVGGFANARVISDLLVGVGVNYAAFENLHLNVVTNTNDRSTNLQAFAAVQYLVRKQLFLKLVGAYAKSHFERSFSSMEPYDDTMFSVRLRAMYLF